MVHVTVAKAVRPKRGLKLPRAPRAVPCGRCLEAGAVGTRTPTTLGASPVRRAHLGRQATTRGRVCLCAKCADAPGPSMQGIRAKATRSARQILSTTRRPSSTKTSRKSLRSGGGGEGGGAVAGAEARLAKKKIVVTVTVIETQARPEMDMADSSHDHSCYGRGSHTITETATYVRIECWFCI